MKKKVETKVIKVKSYRNRTKTADKAPYLMRVVSNGTLHLDDILREVAKETGGTVARARLAHNAMWEVIRKELNEGHKVETPFGLFEPAISGTVPHVDSPLDPKKNKVYIKITPPAVWRKELAKLTPVLVGGPESALMIGEVFTGALGAKGYNVVVPGQSFVVTGDGFLEDGVLSVLLTDTKGVSHDVTVEARKKTALVCTLAGTAAKGKATLEVVLAGEEPDTYRFSASRKVTVARSSCDETVFGREQR